MALLNLYAEMVEYQNKLYDYTLSKCQYERNIETCVVEQIYYQGRVRQVLEEAKMCRDEIKKTFQP